MNFEERNKLIEEHSKLYSNLESLEVIPENDPDLLRMEEIMDEIEKLSKEE